MMFPCNKIVMPNDGNRKKMNPKLDFPQCNSSLIKYLFPFIIPYYTNTCCRRTSVPLSVSLLNDFNDNVFTIVWSELTGGFQDQGSCFFVCLFCSPSSCCPLSFFSSIPWVGCVRFGSSGRRTDRVSSHTPSLAQPTVLIILLTK